ncbi:hypothetical protein D3C84_895950 [compost metagenome]
MFDVIGAVRLLFHQYPLRQGQRQAHVHFAVVDDVGFELDASGRLVEVGHQLRLIDLQPAEQWQAPQRSKRGNELVYLHQLVVSRIEQAVVCLMVKPEKSREGQRDSRTRSRRDLSLNAVSPPSSISHTSSLILLFSNPPDI